MTVVPVPVMPAEPPANEPASGGEPAPGFAEALTAAQQGGPEPAAGEPGGTPGDTRDVTPGTPPARPGLADTTVLALLAGAQAAPAVAAAPAPSPSPGPGDLPAERPAGTTRPVPVPVSPAPPAAPPGPAGEVAVDPAAPVAARPAGEVAAEPGRAGAASDDAGGEGTPAASTPAPPSPPADGRAAAHGGRRFAPEAMPAVTVAPAAGPGTAATAPRAVPAADAPAEVAPPSFTDAVGFAGAAAPSRSDATAGAGPVPAAAPAPAPPPAEQLYVALRPLQRGPDGAHRIDLEMRPPELGRVEVHVELRDGVLHATIRTEHAHAAEVVRGALDDLRARFAADGLRTGQLSVDDRRNRDRGGHERRRAPSPRDESRTAVDPTVTITPEPAPDALLDVRI
jgi:hypothetical protein